MTTSKHRFYQIWVCETFLPRGTRFHVTNSIKENSRNELKAIPKTDYEKCVSKTGNNADMCDATNVDYFEGDKRNFDNLLNIF